MKKCSNRIISLVLCFVILFAVILPASAINASDATLLDDLFYKVGAVSYSELDRICVNVNNAVSVAHLGIPVFHAVIERNPDADFAAGPIFMLKDEVSGEWLHRVDGKFPYCVGEMTRGGGAGRPGDTSYPAETPVADLPGTPETSGNTSNKWRPYTELIGVTTSGKIDTTFDYSVLSGVLSELRKSSYASSYDYSLRVFSGGNLYGISRKSKMGGQFEWLCDRDGYIFLAPENKASSVTNQQFYYNEVHQETVVNDDHTENNVDLDVSDSFNQIINNDDRIFTLVTGNSADTYNSLYLDRLVFDFSTSSYSADTYNVTYDNDNKQYITNNYTYNITYNISNTYVTYIGSNATYEQEAYTFYYELPDGRSSADLTDEEVAAMSFQFYDCINYNRSATNTDLRALFHFDGDLRDAGYYSDRTDFVWNSGASISYMDSGVFGGALYLDETAHDFQISLPSAFYSNQDFTVQFRYYQASEPDTVDNIENSLSVGGATLLYWDEHSLYTLPRSGSPVSAFPVGSWSEIALVRSNGRIYVYVNGISVSTVDLSTVLKGNLRFVFGDTSRAYSMLDELRVLNFAVASGGARYTPTSVPHDSNLVLTLPGTETVTDTYWEFVGGKNLLSSCNFSTGETIYRTADTAMSLNGVDGFWSSYETDGYTFSLSDSFATLKNSRSDIPTDPYFNFASFYGLFYGLDYYGGSTHYYAPGLSNMANKSYTFSVVDSDGKIYSFPFTGGFGYHSSGDLSSKSFSWGTLAYVCVTNDTASTKYTRGLSVRVNPGASLNLVYMELVEGSTTSLTAEKVSCIYSTADLSPNTAAVHTDIPIHGYSVGGVRPTFPVRGDVWFMVTSGRISSVQVYNGSAWESSNARYWTGVRWIPIYAFDIYTLEDCWDIADADDIITQITTEGGFWNWWKSQWLSFRTWLSSIFGNGSVDPDVSPSPSPSPSPGDSFVVPDPTPADWELADYVTIVREDPDYWRVNNAYSFTILGQRGDLWQWDNTVRNLFLVDPAGAANAQTTDFIWSVDVSGLPLPEPGEWDNAGVFWYENDDSYYSISRKSQYDGFTVVIENGNGYAEEFPGVASDDMSTTATFLFCGSGSNFRCYLKTAASGWVPVLFNSSGYVTPDRIGLACWEYRSRGMEVTFSNLHVGVGSDYPISDDNYGSDLNHFISSSPTVPFFKQKNAIPGTSVFQVAKDAGRSFLDLLTGFFNAIFGGVGAFFSFIAGGIADFFLAFSHPNGVFGYYHSGGGDLWG